MLTIWLARHGEAVDPDQAGSDFARTLTIRGRSQVSGLTEWLLDREESPELVLHSPLVRAQQTAALISAAPGDSTIPVRVEHRLSPGIDTDDLLSYLASTALERIACVGHQPDMSRCLSEMVGGGYFHYSPGSMGCIVFTGPIVRGAGRLSWLVEPRWFGH